MVDKQADNTEHVSGEILDENEATNHQLIIPDAVLPGVLTILPLSQRPFFPTQIQPLMLDRESWEETLQQVVKNNESQPVIGLLYCGKQDPLDIDTTRMPAMGCVARLQAVSIIRNQFHVMANGIKRFRVRRWLSDKPPYRVEVDYPANALEQTSDEIKAYAQALIKSIKELLPLNPLYSEELKHYLEHFSPNEPAMLADFAATLTNADGNDLQEVLDTLPLVKRIEKALALIHKEKEVSLLQQEISQQLNKNVNDSQREFFLREQLKIIQNELGIKKDDSTAEIDEFRHRLVGKVLTEPCKKRIDDELHKLSILQPDSAEYGVTRNYLDWATSLPWGVHSVDKLDLKRARRVLNKHHYGLDDVKDRIIEFMALAQFKGEVSGSIILLVGPPGVGKTSIGRSIADSLGRKFFRFSLGGMRDEAEIKGHRRTYIGAMPGKLVQALKEVEVQNPVIMLDEVDKIGASFQGDPASALLEVLDPEQNRDFLDHFLDLRLDLSKVLFICTANQLDTIPRPLLDRMEIIRLAGYITEEKINIASKHLFPRLLKRSSIPKHRLSINKTGLRRVIEDYAREAGVRGLEKQLARIVRKSAVRLLEDENLMLRIGKDDIEELLGKPLFSPEKIEREVGVVTGLAWTTMGGATLSIQCSRIHTLNRGFELTGQLGDVMKESANIAYSYVMSNLAKYKADNAFFDESMVHLHVPEGATPKDGPSAGVTMATALLSLAKNKKLGRPMAMTGELTLTGQVLAVGGIREKVIAARRIGLKELILPEANRGDFEELPGYLQKGLKVHFASNYQDVYNVAFS